MNVAMFTFLVAMGDPNFLPSNPQPEGPEVKSMKQTTGNLNQLDKEEANQPQEQEYNRNDKALDYQLDDAFQESTDNKPNKKEDL